MANIGAKKMFALVVDSVTKEPRRLIDTDADQDDSFLLKAQQTVAADETMILLPIEDYPVRKPYLIAETLGYKPLEATKDVPDAANDQAVSDIAPLVADLSKEFKAAFAVLAKDILSAGKLPRFDSKVRQLLVDELKRLGRDDLTDATTNTPFYVAAVAEAIWAEIQ